MERVSEPILSSQDTSSQGPYHTHTLMTFRVCICAETNYYSSTNLGRLEPFKCWDTKLKEDCHRAPNKRENTKTLEKVKKKKKNDKNRYLHKNKQDLPIGIPGTV